MLKFETDRTCDTCHSALCTVYCRADSAYLCSACDIHIHSANSLARRHHRVPISDNSYGGAVGPSAAEINGFLFGPDRDEDSYFTTTEDNDNAASFCDEYLDLNDYNSNATATLFHDDDHNHKHYDGTSDSVVPSQYNGLSSEYNHNHLTVSFNDVSVNSVEVPTQLTAMEREARVMRYREKKKNRKFEKTIRYASRKAYAETRPRIKGRFAKRNTELEGDEVDDDQVMFSSSLMAENAYGVVPTF